jgi:signal transduction histidine kinase
VTVPEYEFNPKGKTEADGLGRTRWLSTHIFPLKTTSGIIRNIVITHEDITDRRQAEISLIKSKNLLSESQNVARIGSYVLDIKNDQWDSSDVLDEIFDIDKNYNKNISGWLKLVYTNDRDMMINYFNTNILQNNEPFNKEYRIQRIKNQNILWVHGLGKLELDEDGDPIKMIGTIQDISIRKEFEIEKEALENHLQKSQKLETIGTLAGGITHEINQPLNAISISANSVLYWHRNNPGVLPKLFIEELQQISKGAKRIDEIIRHMRSLWVADITTKMEYNSPNQIIIDSLSLIKQQLHAHGIIIEQKFTSQDISLFSDRVSLEQIIINLLINAMHSLDESDQTDKKIIIQTRADKTSCILSISDNGGGLPEGDEMVVFSPFYSTKDPSKSMGLGLAIVKNLVNKMDGSISAVNNKPSGARFIITLPIKDEIE